ncbi:N4 gp30-like protein [Roseovarius sp. 217 phage 1]|uniref:N4 gp30-like protein n=1 Tax=Roseovarius sp. 217 phage 1 TaxID=874471 RepID=E3PZ69_9CAUD|nr:N4 gp30-like protein [Roseovarius sp. 217 phage 1]
MTTDGSVYTYVEQPQLQVEVILASTAADAPPIYTIRMRYPRPIHGEIMTHRVFGRNARSSRAVPVRTMLNEVRTIPYVPWHWLKNKPGMQGTEPLTPEEEEEAITYWLSAANTACHHVEQLFDPDGLNIHKQNPNRLLEPFSWMDTLITATEWNNFLWLRQHGAAEPHLQDLANLVYQAIEDTQLILRDPDEWHMPYITYEERTQYHSDVLLKISAARCARISYKPFNGDGSVSKELERADLLMNDERVHASPFEHQAKPDTLSWNFPEFEGEPDVKAWANPMLHGNLTGWIQYRKLIPNEVYHG